MTAHNNSSNIADNSNIAVEIDNLRKTYIDSNKSQQKEALKGIDLIVPRGSFFALLGPNGAGKSTLINIIAGLVLKTSGTVKICGYDHIKDMRNARKSIGVVPQELILDTFFTVREALDIHAGYYGVAKNKRRTQEIIDALGLSDKADVNSRRLSGGMRRRLLVAKALVHNPPVLILDEPTAGVDVELRTQLWEYVKALNKQGTTVLLTTHYLEEAEALCDRIAVINNGKLVACDAKENLLKIMDSKELVITPLDNIATIPETMKNLKARLDSGKIIINYQPSKITIQEILNQVAEAQINVRDLTTREANLEDVFVHLTREKSA